MGEAAKYVDIYNLPVPEANLERYRAQATEFGAVAIGYGALRYREFAAEDLGDGMEPEDGMVLIAVVVEFTSKSHREEVMTAVMADDRVKALQEGEQVTDMSRMVYGGFETFVEA